MRVRRKTLMIPSGAAAQPAFAPDAAEATDENRTDAQLPPPPVGSVKLNFNVSPSVANEVRTLARDLDVSMTQLFRYAFGILKIAVNEAKRKRKLVIADETGNAIREIVLPGIE